MLSKHAFDVLGPVIRKPRMGFLRAVSARPRVEFVSLPVHWLIAAAEKHGGIPAGAAAMVRFLQADHLNDQLSSLSWLQKQRFIVPNRIAVAGTPAVAFRRCSAQNDSGKTYKLNIYPPYGNSRERANTFGYFGAGLGR